MLNVQNRLLQLLPVEDQTRLLQDADLVTLTQREILIEPDERFEHAYFPDTCLISQLCVLNDGSAIESGLIGNEGFVGLTSFLGAELSPMRYVVHLPGYAYRMPVGRLRDWVSDVPRLQTLLGRYNDFLLAVASQSAACTGIHSVDRVPGNEIPLTHESLAQMLGVRRASVSVAAGLLQDKGVIRYAYGRVTIVDREALEAVSCECSEAVARRYQSLFASLMG
jgi:CRP-like cAMP-binding protein